MSESSVGGGREAQADVRGEAAVSLGSPPALRVIVVSGGDTFAAGALRVATLLAELFPSEPPIMIDGNAAVGAVGRHADGLTGAVVVLPMPEVGSTDRSRYAERACRMAAATRHPVLVVSPSATWPPRRCVAAMDFSRGAISAAIFAVNLVSRPGQAAHVFVDEPIDRGADSDGETIPRHIRLLFDTLPMALRQRTDILVTQHCLRGRRVPRLIDFTLDWGADLLSCGRQGHPSWAARPNEPIGPTVLGLLEAAPCSLVLSGRA